MKVIVSAGFKNFHLLTAAAEAYAHSVLDIVIVGAYPSRRLAAVVSRMSFLTFTKKQKFLNRAVTVSEGSVRSVVSAELLGDVAIILRRYLSEESAQRIAATAMRFYARAAGRIITRRKLAPGDIYHYRAGYGLRSLSKARQQGAVLLCDHSIVHPRLLLHLTEDGGTLEPVGDPPDLDPVWSLVENDILQADHVLVNSDFVRDGFLQVGFPREKLTVIPQGIEDGFPKVPRLCDPVQQVGPIRFLFAGRLSARKGARVLLRALQQLPQGCWTLAIAGTQDHEFQSELAVLTGAGSVRLLGNLSREQIAAAMAEAEVFVFPTLAEGSARVVFEAMACGCYIITTPNAGSVVEDGVHGELVPPGNVERLAQAMRNAFDRTRIASAQTGNGSFVREHYGQQSYGRRLIELYSALSRQRFSAGNCPLD